MESTRPPSRRLTRSRSGTPRLCHVAAPLSPIPGVLPQLRPRSAAKTAPSAAGGECIRQRCKENRESLSSCAETVGPGVKKGWKAVPTSGCVVPSAWALSPGRYPAVDAAAAKGGGAAGKRRIGGVFGFFRQKKEPSSREEAGHQLRVMAVRLLQWRFVNARAEAAMYSAKAAAEKKLFFAWLKITELRNIAAAKMILIQRRKHKLKVIKVLNPHVSLLNRWELMATRHLEAVASLATALEVTCIPIPLAEGAQANLVLVHKYICTSMDIMFAIEAAIKIFYSKAERVSSLLCKLVKVTLQEIEGLDGLWRTNNLITYIEMHDFSLRANLIQARKKETASPPICEINRGQFRAIYLS